MTDHREVIKVFGPSYRRGKATPTPGSITGKIVFFGIWLLLGLTICYYLSLHLPLGVIKIVHVLPWWEILVIYLIYFLGICLLTILPTWLLISAIREYPLAKKLFQRGQVTEGLVLNTDVSYGRDESGTIISVSYSVIFQYLVNNKKYILEQWLRQKEFKDLDLRSGGTAKVRYLPDNPGVARLSKV